MLKITEEWRKAFPGAYAGILDMRDVVNPDHHPGLDARKRRLEDDLRVRFKEPAELKLLAPIAAYKAFYKGFKKSYHVQHQLESVIFKGKSIPKVAALVEAMFIAELRNMLLTAGHDRDSIRNEITLDVSKGTERYVKINGEEQELKAGDMMMADAEGVISSVIYGPDRRTMITSKTRSALFTVYAVQGIGEQEVSRHLEEIADNVKLISPDCRVVALEVYAAG
ncbi:MAG TPA: phenylalanine--tRNA ligase beta subunit-related protein [Desulfomonilaceae bacterium]|nr:phenylalanine--tRNA ligase beta subunit-related protein [Desulfomonilaceae bacterium]